MRRILLFPAVMLGTLILCQSCSKESQTVMAASQPSQENRIINASVASNASYQLVLDNLENVKVHKQAVHAQLSTTAVDSKSGYFVYNYQPAAEYAGPDEVVLSSTKTVSVMVNNGCNHSEQNMASVFNSSTSYITVKLNVTK